MKRSSGQSGATIPALTGLSDLWIKANPDLNLQVFIDAVDYGVSVENPPVGFQWQIDIQEVVIKGWNGDISAEQIASASRCGRRRGTLSRTSDGVGVSAPSASSSTSDDACAGGR